MIGIALPVLIAVFGYTLGYREAKAQRECIKEICVGDDVEFSGYRNNIDSYYRSCRKITILGFRAESDRNVAWVYLNDCAGTSDATDILDTRYLRKRIK